jgi:hypothetical protein
MAGFGRRECVFSIPTVSTAENLPRPSWRISDPSLYEAFYESPASIFCKQTYRFCILIPKKEVQYERAITDVQAVVLLNPG